MALQEKYATLISAAKTLGVQHLQVREQDNVLYIDGEAASGNIKDNLWDEYEKTDPDFRSGDLVLNITAPAVSQYVVKAGDNLSKIGRKAGKTWKEIYEANKEAIGSNPDLIRPGQVLNIPA